MKISKSIFRIAAIAFMAVAVASCSSKPAKSSDDDDDEDDSKSGRRTEKQVNSNNQGSVVSSFCYDVNAIAEFVDNATSADEIVSAQSEIKNMLSVYENDTTPFTDDDKNEILDALSTLFGAVTQKLIDLNDPYMDEDQQYQVGLQVGRAVAAAVQQSDNFKELYTNLNNFN